MNAGTVSPSSPKRRWFLKTALAVAAVGAAVGGSIWWNRGFENDNLDMTPHGRAVFRALASAIVGPMLPTDPAKREATLDQYMTRLAQAVRDMPAAKRLQLSLLVGALSNAPTRYLSSGMWTSWDKATDAQVLAALEHMRTADAAAQHTLFAATRGLTALMFFSTPENWSLSGYPGPMSI